MRLIIPLLLLFYSCSTNRMGKAKYGKDGKLENETTIKRCTPPTKRYTKDLDLRVKNSVDSLSILPKTQIDIGLKQTVTRLSDYTSEGLDIDLILFHLCETSQNNHFSDSLTGTLFQSAIDAWSKKKTSQ